MATTDPAVESGINLSAAAAWLLTLHSDALLVREYRAVLAGWRMLLGTDDEVVVLAAARTLINQQGDVLAYVPTF